MNSFLFNVWLLLSAQWDGAVLLRCLPELCPAHGHRYASRRAGAQPRGPLSSSPTSSFTASGVSLLTIMFLCAFQGQRALEMTTDAGDVHTRCSSWRLVWNVVEPRVSDSGIPRVVCVASSAARASRWGRAVRCRDIAVAVRHSTVRHSTGQYGTTRTMSRCRTVVSALNLQFQHSGEAQRKKSI